MSTADATVERDLASEPEQSLADRFLPLRWLISREANRIFTIYTQTIVAPIVSSFLFIMVFGLSLGERIRGGIEGIPYDVYIVPGLIAMAMVQACFSNSSTSIFQAQNDGYIYDVLAAPMKPWEINIGMAIGGMLRALTIGGALLALSFTVIDVRIEKPLFLLVAVVLLLVSFSFFGMVVGLNADSFDHHQFVNNLIVLPLTFLGGVFYSVSNLAQPWEELSHFNPIFYLIQTVRYGFLGHSDVNHWLALGVTFAMAVVAVAWSNYLFVTGKKLKA